MRKNNRMSSVCLSLRGGIHFGSRFGFPRILFIRAEGRRVENVAAPWSKVRSRQSAVRLFAPFFTKSQPNSNNLLEICMSPISFGEIFTLSLPPGHHVKHTFEICIFPISFGLRGNLLVGLFGNRLTCRKTFFSFVVHEITLSYCSTSHFLPESPDLGRKMVFSSGG